MICANRGLWLGCRGRRLCHRLVLFPLGCGILLFRLFLVRGCRFGLGVLGFVLGLDALVDGVDLGMESVDVVLDCLFD